MRLKQKESICKHRTEESDPNEPTPHYSNAPPKNDRLDELTYGMVIVNLLSILYFSSFWLFLTQVVERVIWIYHDLSKNKSTPKSTKTHFPSRTKWQVWGSLNF